MLFNLFMTWSMQFFRPVKLAKIYRLNYYSNTYISGESHVVGTVMLNFVLEETI